ncbi:MAG TPA: peptide deformylase [Candidatus Saccharimonadales bacterium]|nr:peptide deformylase [Candidatus Saccharimonadales bacterium]
MSAKDALIVLPDARLRQKSQKVAVITPQVRQIIEEMKSATLDWESTREHEVGVALAGVQIDRPLKIIIIRHDFENKEDKGFSVFINPQIVKFEGELVEDYEGCLSVKDIYGKVPRYSKVRVRAMDENGQPVRVRAEGFLARVFQHEIDHCAGVVFVDHIKDKPEAFYKLTDEGKLEQLPYEQVKQAHIF